MSATNQVTTSIAIINILHSSTCTTFCGPGHSRSTLHYNFWRLGKVLIHLSPPIFRLLSLRSTIIWFVGWSRYLATAYLGSKNRWEQFVCKMPFPNVLVRFMLLLMITNLSGRLCCGLGSRTCQRMCTQRLLWSRRFKILRALFNNCHIKALTIFIPAWVRVSCHHIHVMVLFINSHDDTAFAWHSLFLIWGCSVWNWRGLYRARGHVIERSFIVGTILSNGCCLDVARWQASSSCILRFKLRFLVLWRASELCRSIVISCQHGCFLILDMHPKRLGVKSFMHRLSLTLMTWDRFALLQDVRFLVNWMIFCNVTIIIYHSLTVLSLVFLLTSNNLHNLIGNIGLRVVLRPLLSLALFLSHQVIHLLNERIASWVGLWSGVFCYWLVSKLSFMDWCHNRLTGLR